MRVWECERCGDYDVYEVRSKTGRRVQILNPGMPASNMVWLGKSGLHVINKIGVESKSNNPPSTA
jgi:hypothetical protein